MAPAMKHVTALVTGTTSGLGYAAACALAAKGWSDVIVTGRSLTRTQETAARLTTDTALSVFTPLELDLDKPSSVQSALATLVARGQPIDLLLLNAGMVPGKNRVITAAGIEASQAPLVGHHQLTVGLLNANLLRPNARIIIAGAEPARGDVPLFKFTDLAALAAAHYKGELSASLQDILRNGPHTTYNPNRAYADAKLIIVWWVAALARRLPPDMAVYAVSPGSAPDTGASRNAAPVVKWVMMPLIKLIPGMSQTTDEAAGRYLQASEFGTDVSGRFFASPPKRVTGPLEEMRHPHFYQVPNQEAAWQAVVKVSGADLAGSKDL